MNGWWIWLISDQALAVLACVVFTAVVVSAVLACEIARHSTVETSASGDPAPSGADVWVVEPEREVVTGGLPRDGSARVLVAVGPSTTRTRT